MGNSCAKQQSSLLGVSSYHRLDQHQNEDSASLDSLDLEENLLRFEDDDDEVQAKVQLKVERGLHGDESVFDGQVRARTDSFDNLMTCPICLDFLYEPVTSPCHHHFCKPCVRRLLEYCGDEATCPKCRASLLMDPDNLHVNHNLSLTVLANYAEETCAREAIAQREEQEYIKARDERRRREELLATDPLSYMFESEDNQDRRRILRRDLRLLSGLGFGITRSQKALFVASGNHAEALNWLAHHQHDAGLDVPWNMTELQEQLALRNTRRSLISLVSPHVDLELIPGRLSVSISTITTSGSMGAPCWLFVTTGFQALNNPELVFSIKCFPVEDSFPADVPKFLRRVYRQTVQGHDLVPGNLFCFQQPQHPSISSIFLGVEDIGGVMLARHAGQNLSGYSLSRGSYLYCILVKKQELKWAKSFPTRFLLHLGKSDLTCFPFPLDNDRVRAPLLQNIPFDSCKPLASAVSLNRAACLRVVPEVSQSNPFVWLALPEESHPVLQNVASSWPKNLSFPLITGIYKGADSHLVYSGSSRCPSLYLPTSQTHAVAGTFILLTRDKKGYGSGGLVQEDGMIMNLSDVDFESVMNAICSKQDITIESRQRNALDLRVRWLPSSAIDGGFAHLDRTLFPTLHLNQLITEAASPQYSSVLPVFAETSHQVECPPISPRIHVIGAAFRGSHDNILERIEESILNHYCQRLITRVSESIDSYLLPAQQTGSLTPSTVTVHCDLIDRGKAKYRISKTWDDRCPQAPNLTISKWSDVLHPVPVPEVHGKVELQITFQII